MKKHVKSTKDDSLFWFSKPPSVESLSLPPLPEVQLFKHTFWPHSLPYFNPMIAIFSNELADIGFLSKHENWFFRDGLIPLLFFFKRYPRPPKSDFFIYIEFDFLGLVPAAWRAHVKGYQFTQIKKPKSEVKNLYITGFSSAALTGNRTLENMLERLNNEFSIDFEKVETTIYLPVRFSGQAEGGDFHGKTFFSLARAFGLNTKIIDWVDISSRTDMHNSLHYSLIPKTVIADSFVSNFFMSRGAVNVDIKQSDNFDKINVHLSENHGIQLFDQIDFSEHQHSAQEQVKRIYADPCYNHLSWQQWFSQNWRSS